MKHISTIRFRRGRRIRWLLGLLFALLVLAGCKSEEEHCTQSEVDECFAEVDCDGSGVCSLSVAQMNDLCLCLTRIECDDEWYDAYCGDAPYSADAGCPLCASPGFSDK